VCRMFAVRASHVVDAIVDLMSAKYSLCRQSRCDLSIDREISVRYHLCEAPEGPVPGKWYRTLISRTTLTNRDHSDGWGISCYQRGGVHWARQSKPAYGDVRFEEMIRRCRGKTIVAHVRRASRGIVKIENCHPFVTGHWTFVHNGTLTALDALRETLTDEIGEPLRSQIMGETDSELIFYWLMQRLIDGHAIRGDHCVSLKRTRSIFAGGVKLLDQRNSLVQSATESPGVARLNFILTNGSMLIGSRLRNSLYVLHEDLTHPTGPPRRSIAVASEPTDGRKWKEVPDGSVYTISSGLKWACENL
jgi:predicted glutamine amidotransferase